MGRYSRLLVLLCTVLLAGCGSIASKYPVGLTAGPQRDATLIGTWKGQFKSDDDKSPPFYLHFLTIKDGPMLAIWVATRMDDKGNGGAMLFDISTAKLGGNRFISSRDYKVGSDKPQGNYSISLYRLDGASGMTLFYLDRDKTAAAIRAGKIAGTISSDGNDVLITAEPAALDAFMGKPEAAGLFEEKMVLKRVE